MSASSGDVVAIATEVTKLLRGRELACAESITAGRIASAVACVEDAADFFRGGLVAYQEETKRRLLGVVAPSVLSSAAAEEMAVGVSRLLVARVTVATTGLAGGEPQDGVSVGTVFVATCIDGNHRSWRHHFEGDPEQVCDQATEQALSDLLESLAETGQDRAVPAGPRQSSWATGESLASSDVVVTD